MNIRLVVIDAQEDFTRGALRNEEAIAALPTIREVVDYAYEHFDKPILYTQDIHTKAYLNTLEGINLPVSHCIVNTKGCQICHEVLTDKAEFCTKNTFGYTHWDEKDFNGVCKIMQFSF